MYNNINDSSVASAVKRISTAAVGAICLTLGTAGVGRAIVTYGNNPNDPMYTAQPGMFSGVGLIELPGSDSSHENICTGSLLNGGLDVLTAAHCVANDNGSLKSNVIGNTTVNFVTAGIGPLPVNNFYVDPNYNSSDQESNNDIAVLQLAEPAPTNVQQYGIYTNSNEVGQTFTKVGYGQYGNGNQGGVNPTDLANPVLRYGQNQYDALLSNFAYKLKGVEDPAQLAQDPLSSSQLIYGFTNGNPANDPFQVHFGFPSYTGPLESEVFISEGDSGGPGFIGNLIASITSYGFSDATSPFLDGQQADIDKEIDGTFGEFASDTRVSYYQNFIDGVLAGTIDPTTPVPEPSTTWGLFTLGGLGTFSLLRRKKF